MLYRSVAIRNLTGREKKQKGRKEKEKKKTNRRLYIEQRNSCKKLGRMLFVLSDITVKGQVIKEMALF